MLIAAMVFAGVLLIVLGAYWTLVLRHEERILGRLTPARAGERTLVRSMLRGDVPELSSVGLLRFALAHSGSWAVRLQAMIEQAGIRMTVGTLLLSMACAGMAALVAVMWLTRVPMLSLLAGALVAWVPYAYVASVRTRRLRSFEDHFPEAIDLIARALRAGHALPTGIAMAAEEVPAPVGPEFRILFDEQNFGLTLPDALRNFARRVPVLDARFFVTAVLTQREAGGNLAEVLDNLAAVIRERFKVKRQVRVISAHGRLTGAILALLPVCLAVATLIINPAHLGALIQDPIGQRMVMAAAGLQVVGVLMIRRIVNVEY
jgi:tight adherence protein B